MSHEKRIEPALACTIEHALGILEMVPAGFFDGLIDQYEQLLAHPLHRSDVRELVGALHSIPLDQLHDAMAEPPIGAETRALDRRMAHRRGNYNEVHYSSTRQDDGAEVV